MNCTGPYAIILLARESCAFDYAASVGVIEAGQGAFDARPIRGAMRGRQSSKLP